MLRIYLLVSEGETDGIWGRMNKSDAILGIGEHHNRIVSSSEWLLLVL